MSWWQFTTRSVENDETFRQQLTERVLSTAQPPKDYQGFLHDPLSIWIERTFGIMERDGLVESTTPKSISGERGAAHELSATTGTEFERCVEAIQRSLLAGYECEPIPAPFAFCLHQFITKGDTLYASLESAGKRYLTLNGQRFVPDGQRERILLPLVFCRKCGQEYYCVRINEGRLVPRVLNDQAQEEGQAGFLFYSQDNPWPDNDEEKLVERLPEDWIEEFKNTYRVRLPRKKDLPITLRVHLDGKFGEGHSGSGIDGDSVDGDGLMCQFVSAPFRFCLHCGVSYNARQRLDFGKLAALSSEGRSTATTILSLSAIRYLREKPQEDIPAKLLSFTDNRQDASLQAGRRAKDVIATLQEDLLQQADWYKDEWLDRVLDHVALSFEHTTGRWRELYRAARRQIDIQHKIRNDPARSPEDRERAERLRDEAEAQEKLLTDSSTLEQSDFYSYRYFASEGFLPGYNFPRLPLSAYIPGRRARQQDRNEYLSRPRFLAISEFGPRAIVYHEGSRYEINRVILSVESGENLTTSGVKQCENCGYLHPLSDVVNKVKTRFSSRPGGDVLLGPEMGKLSG